MIDVVTLLISLLAITIAILGYLDNRKNISIVLKKENERRDIKDALKELTLISDLLKELPDNICFAQFDFLISDIVREVYENDMLELTIKFQNLEFLIPEYDRNKTKYSTIKYNGNSIATQSLRETIKKLLVVRQNSELKYSGNLSLNFVTHPEMTTNFVELIDILNEFIKIEDSIERLDKFDFVIENFDSALLKNIKTSYEEMLSFLADILKNEGYTIDFHKDIKPSEIEHEIYEIFNFNMILEKAEYLSTEVVNKIDELRKDLAKQILTY